MKLYSLSSAKHLLWCRFASLLLLLALVLSTGLGFVYRTVWPGLNHELYRSLLLRPEPWSVWPLQPTQEYAGDSEEKDGNAGEFSGSEVDGSFLAGAPETLERGTRDSFPSLESILRPVLFRGGGKLVRDVMKVDVVWQDSSTETFEIGKSALAQSFGEISKQPVQSVQVSIPRDWQVVFFGKEEQVLFAHGPSHLHVWRPSEEQRKLGIERIQLVSYSKLPIPDVCSVSVCCLDLHLSVTCVHLLPGFHAAKTLLAPENLHGCKTATVAVPSGQLAFLFTREDFRELRQHESPLLSTGTWKVTFDSWKSIHVNSYEGLFSLFPNVPGFLQPALNADTWEKEYGTETIHYAPMLREFPETDVTLVVQLSVNRLARFVRAIMNWPRSPVSAVIHLCKPWDILHLLYFLQETRSEYFWDRVSITVIKPAYHQNLVPFPINRLRNLGISRAPTNFVLVIDADFVPAIGLAVLARNVIVPELLRSPTPTAAVIPCFALSQSYQFAIPASMEELRELFLRNHIYITDPGSGHGPTQYPLLLQQPFLGSQNPFHEVCYEGQWEPYYVVAKYLTPQQARQGAKFVDAWCKIDPALSSSFAQPLDGTFLPPYDERFENQGGDKQQHAAILNALGYRFLVAEETFLLHLDHPSSSTATDRQLVEQSSAAWSWPGGLKHREASNFSYFTEFLGELQDRFGRNARWPRGCTFPLVKEHGMSLMAVTGGF